MIINESGSNHIDHAYFNPENGNDVVMKHTVLEEEFDSLTEHSNSIPSGASRNTNAQQEPTLVNGCREAEFDVIYESYICDGGEVEILNATAHPLNKTIPLPKEELVYQHPGDSVGMSIMEEDCGGQDQQDHTDHPYSSKECEFSCSIEQSPKLTDGPTDITWRSFVCTGGEVELSDTTTVAEETIPLPSVQLNMSNYLAQDESIINQSELAANQIIDPCIGHLEHCYFNKDLNSPSSDLKAPQELPSSSAEAHQLNEHDSVTDGGKTNAAFDSLSGTGGDVHPTDAFILLEKPLPLLEDPTEVSPTSYDIRAVGIVESHDPDSQHQQPFALKRDESIEAAAVNDVITDASIPVTNIQPLQDVSQTDLSPAEANAVSCAFQPFDAADQGACEASAQPHSFITVQVEGHVISDSEVELRSSTLASSGAQVDGALGMSGYAQGAAASVDEAPAGHSDVLAELPEFPAVPNLLQFDLLSPVTRIRTYKDSPLAKYLAEDSLLDRESLAEKDPYTVPLRGPLVGPLESPISRPLFNSTALHTRYLVTPRTIRDREVPKQLPQAIHSLGVAVPASQELKGLPDPPLIPNGSLQQQLRQMAEILILASGKMCTESAPMAVTVAVDAIAPPAVESHSICVGTSPVKWVDRCFNTSGQFVRKREISVADGCTSTDPLLWK